MTHRKPGPDYNWLDVCMAIIGFLIVAGLFLVSIIGIVGYRG